MTKRVLVISGMLLFSGKLHAQSTDTPALPTATFSRSDTVRAVQHIFSKHRTGGWIWTAVGGALALRIAYVDATTNSSAGLASTTGGTIVGIGLFGGLPVGIGVGKLTRFSNVKEEQVVTFYEKSGILPPYVRKRLKTKHFR